MFGDELSKSLREFQLNVRRQIKAIIEPVNEFNRQSKTNVKSPKKPQSDRFKEAQKIREQYSKSDNPFEVGLIEWFKRRQVSDEVA